MQLKRYALLLTLVLALIGCDSGGENEPSERTYEVEYLATAEFEQCTVIYYNESGGVTTVTEPFAGQSWTRSFSVTIEDEFGSELVGFDLRCSDFSSDEAQSASAELRLDGETFLDASDEGQSVSFSLDARLSLDGATEFIRFYPLGQEQSLWMRRN
jgi:hypothetical protein